MKRDGSQCTSSPARFLFLHQVTCSVRWAFEREGLTGLETVVASGNLLFDYDERPLEGLEDLFAQKEAPLPSLLDAHIAAAEALACDEASKCILWANADGDAAFGLVAELPACAMRMTTTEDEALRLARVHEQEIYYVVSNKTYYIPVGGHA